MAFRIQRAGFVSALILSLFAVHSGAQGKGAGLTSPNLNGQAAKDARQKLSAIKRATAELGPYRPSAKGQLKSAAQHKAQAEPVTVASKARHAGAGTAASTPGAAAADAPQTQAVTAPGCVPNLVNADFQTLPVAALEGLGRRLEALGLTRSEADTSVRTLTERAGGVTTGGSVIVARYVDSCDPRRVQVISVSLALDGPTSVTWLRGHDAPSVVVAAPTSVASVPAETPTMVALETPSVAATSGVPEQLPAAETGAVATADPAASAPVEAIRVPAGVIETAAKVPDAPIEPEPEPVLAALPDARPTPAEVPAPSVTIAPPSAERADTGVTVAGFSVGSFATKPETQRSGFSDTPPGQAPLGFHLRVAGQVTDGDLGPALSAAGLPLPVVQQVLDSFAADGKMPLASAENLAFDVLYRTELDTNSEPVLTSAELSHSGQSRRLYYYVPEEGTAHLIDQEGKVRLAQGPDFIHPLPGQRMTSGFGWRMHPVLRARKFHKGVDWSAPRGTPVVAAGDGIVETVKSHRGYGKYIRIVHDERTETVYAHLDQFAKGLKVGQAVRQGQVIGTVGRTGIASGNHLYFELVVDGRHIDPLRNVPALVQDLLAEGKDKEDQQRFVSFADTLLQSVPATAIAAHAQSGYRTARTEPAPGDIP